MSWDNWIDNNTEDTELEIGLRKYSRLATEIGVKVKSRKPELVMRRWLFWEDAFKTLPISISAAARITGHDHATVLNGFRKLENFRETRDKMLEVAERDYSQVKSSFIRAYTEPEEN